MTESSEYIEVSKLPKIINNNKGPHLISIYQIQGQLNTQFAKIMIVGVAEKLPYVLIKSFDISTKTKCLLLSFFYTDDDIKRSVDNKIYRLTLIELVINKNTGQNFIPIGSIRFNFNTDQDVSNLINKNIKGYYSITLHYDNKYIILKELEKYPGNTGMIDSLLEQLFNEDIKDILNL